MGVRCDVRKLKKIKLSIGKTLDGNILITDHQNMNVIVMPDKGIILAIPKGELAMMFTLIKISYFNI